MAPIRKRTQIGKRRLPKPASGAKASFNQGSKTGPHFKVVKRAPKAVRIEQDIAVDEVTRVTERPIIDVQRLPPEVRKTTMEEPGKIADAVKKALEEEAKRGESKKKKPKHEFADIPFPPGKIYTGKGKDVHTLYNLWSSALKNQMKASKNATANLENTISALKAELQQKRHGKNILRTITHISLLWDTIMHPFKATGSSATATRIKIRRLEKELARIKRFEKEWMELYEKEIRLLDEAYNRYKENPTKENAERFAQILREIIKRNQELIEACYTGTFTELSHWKFFKYGNVSRASYRVHIMRSRRLRKHPEEIKKMFAAAFATLDEMR